jgi:hypothetical protein
VAQQGVAWLIRVQFGSIKVRRGSSRVRVVQLGCCVTH